MLRNLLPLRMYETGRSIPLGGRIMLLSSDAFSGSATFYWRRIQTRALVYTREAASGAECILSLFYRNADAANARRVAC
jgi:hypothetical protein